MTKRQSDRAPPLQNRSWFNLTISEWNFHFQITVNIVELAENFKLPQAVNVPFPLILLRPRSCTVIVQYGNMDCQISMRGIQN